MSITTLLLQLPWRLLKHTARLILQLSVALLDFITHGKISLSSINSKYTEYNVKMWVHNNTENSTSFFMTRNKEIMMKNSY
jgi:hypothetical protein